MSDAPEHEITRSGEELRIGTRDVDAGTVRLRKDVTTGTVSAPLSRTVEELDQLDRVPPHPEDSGQIETLEDGSISIPILEEQLVVTKRVVVTERVIVRKRVTIVEQTIEGELRTERLVVERSEPK
jgi:uncharacterized protein (TIGR02271 family)